jgi:hypothetical protein
MILVDLHLNLSEKYLFFYDMKSRCLREGPREHGPKHRGLGAAKNFFLNELAGLKEHLK